MDKLEIRNLGVKIEEKTIIEGLNLTINAGEVHVIMGPNGSGKSTLCFALMGHPKYETDGEALLDGENLLEMEVDERAKKGLFLGFQYPKEVPGITLGNFLRVSSNNLGKSKNAEAKPIGPAEYFKKAVEILGDLGLEKRFVGRHLNVGFSGGEKKRAEIAQLFALKPKFALLDEIDSGLDIDALKLVAEGINKANKEFGTGVLLITHYQRILEFIKPDFVHVMKAGKIVRSGGLELSQQLEKEGYEKYK